MNRSDKSRTSKVRSAPEAIDTEDPRLPGYVKDIHLARYDLAAGIVPGCVVLDLGCGLGYGAAMLAESARHVTGVDRDPEKIRIASLRYGGKPNLEFVTSGCLEFLSDYHGTFDTIVALEILEHLPTYQHEQLLEQVASHLVVGGKLVISTPNRKYTPLERRWFLWKNPYHLGELGYDEFVTLVSRRLRILSLFGQTPFWLLALPRPAFWTKLGSLRNQFSSLRSFARDCETIIAVAERSGIDGK